MARIKQVGNGRDLFAVVFKNSDTQVIKANAPIILDFAAAAADLGKACKTTNSLAVAEHGNFFGINISGDIGVGFEGEAQVYGYNPNARVILTTRTATNATWASIAAGSIGEFLTLGSGTGSHASLGDQALVRAGLNLTQTISQTVTAAGTLTLTPIAQFVAKLGETFASTDTQASSLGPQSQTIWTGTRKIFIARM